MPNINIIQRIASGITRTRTVTEPVDLYVRESRKQPGVLVVGIQSGDTRKRVALVRVEDGGNTVKVRTLDGDPKERSSKALTQRVLRLRTEALTEDAA